MYLNDLLRELSDLPYEEQQLFLKMNQLVLKSYSIKANSVGRENAIEMLNDVFEGIQSSIDNNQIGKSK